MHDLAVPRLSAVVPMYNEEAVLPLFVARLRPVLDGLGVPYEVVAVDDGSTDATAVLLQRYHREWPQLRILRLRANAGHQAAISAGLVAARGDYVVTLDADLQDPPEVIAEMMALATKDELDVVYGVRSDRSSDSAFKRGTANAFYRMIRRMTSASTPMSAGDYRLMSRATVDAVNVLPEQHRVLRLVVPALNFPSATVEYRREPRAAGASKYSLRHMTRLALDSVTAFSIVPLRVATWLGLCGAVAAVIVGGYAVTAEIVTDTVPGWASLVGTVSAFSAVQLVCIGVLGEYVGRMYVMQQGRPTYSVLYDSLTTPPRAVPQRPPLDDRAADGRSGIEVTVPSPADRREPTWTAPRSRS